MPIAQETWLPHPDWAGYYLVSDHGRVRSVTRRLSDGRLCGGLLLRQTRDSKGYFRVTLCRDGRQCTRRVHDLVMETHCGRKPAGRQVRHLNDRQADNRRVNLRYGTQSQNEKDKQRNRGRSGSRNGRTTEVTFVTGTTAYRVSGLATRPR